jgi:hypothetical protein
LYERASAKGVDPFMKKRYACWLLSGSIQDSAMRAPGSKIESRPPLWGNAETYWSGLVSRSSAKLRKYRDCRADYIISVRVIGSDEDCSHLEGSGRGSSRSRDTRQKIGQRIASSEVNEAIVGVRIRSPVRV